LEYGIARIAGIFGVFAVYPVTHAQTSDEFQNVAALESVFRYQVPRCFSELSPETYFLSYLRHDPSDALMEKLAARGLVVKKRSQFSRFRDRETGKWSVILAVTSVENFGARRVMVRIECIAGSLTGYSFSHRVVLSRGRWVVTRTNFVGVS
jgi:hypothetical protein